VEFFKATKTIDFLQHRTKALVFSSILIVGTFVSLFYPGPNLGVDFAGGTEVELQFRGDVAVDELRKLVTDLGHDSPEIVAVQGEKNRYVLRVKEDSEHADKQTAAIRKKLEAGIDGAQVTNLRLTGGANRIELTLSQASTPDAITQALASTGVKVRSVSPMGRTEENRFEAQLTGAGDVLVAGLQDKLGERGPEGALRVEWVGPKAGAQLRDAAIKSMLYTMALIMVYVAFRFDLRFAPGGVIAIFHDAIIVLGAYVLVQKELTLGTIAAILTIIGYSINDTIVIFDRIRENLARARDATLTEVINQSLTQTLSRTIITSSVTMFSILGFFFFGTPIIQDIAFALLVGFFSGTYSTIYIATPVVEWIDRKFFNKVVATNKPIAAT
jgi:preprotein translocase subunit SecF